MLNRARSVSATAIRIVVERVCTRGGTHLSSEDESGADVPLKQLKILHIQEEQAEHALLRSNSLRRRCIGDVPGVSRRRYCPDTPLGCIGAANHYS